MRMNGGGTVLSPANFLSFLRNKRYLLTIVVGIVYVLLFIIFFPFINNRSDYPGNVSPTSRRSARLFQAFGKAAALYVHFGAYRGGSDSFSVIGLGSKPTHVYSKPWFRCEWISNQDHVPNSYTKGKIFLPDWGYGRVYTVVVVNCTFQRNPNADNYGGKLFVYAFYSPSPLHYEKFFLLEEPPGSYDESRFRPPFKYDYLYCGSALFGSLNPRRVREWISYHAFFFGPNSHFMLYDAGGISADVKKVLDPWIELGRVTLQDVRRQEDYDSWYYNQFLILNDCLHQNRYTANWTFLFDVDEYIYLPDGSTLESVLEELEDYSQFTIEQNPMSGKLCVDDPSRNYPTEWGFEKLNFREDITGLWRDRKYAVKARNAYTVGVHMSEFLTGKTMHDTETKIRYYHYHGTTGYMGEVCRNIVPLPEKDNATWFEKAPYVYDDNLTRFAPVIKQFERQMIGSRQAFLD